MIRRQVVVPAAPERVWEFITDPEAAGPWLGGRLTWSAAAGGELSFESVDGTVRRGVVEEVRPNRYIRYAWWPADPDSGSDPGAGEGPTGGAGEAPEPGSRLGSGPGPVSQVALLLEPVGDHTRVTATEKIVEVERLRPGSGPGPAGLESAPPTAPQAFMSVSVAAVAPSAGTPLVTWPTAALPAVRSTTQWSAGDDDMLSSWTRARARSLCQVG